MEWDRLISDYLDDALTPQEVAALFQWIGSHPDNAKRFAQAAFLHHCLHHRLSAMRLLGQTRLADADRYEPSGTDANPLKTPEPGSVVHPVRSQYSNWRRWCGIAAALLLIVGVLAFFTWPRRSPARLLAAENATWGSDIVPPKVGDNLPQGDWFLDTGFIKLGFDNGNQLVIQGPARFAITDDLAVTLNRGSLTAVVTKSGRGLRVTTSTVQVTDLGTEFGVQASLNKTRVAVFKGKIVVDQNATGANPMELSQGSAVEVSASGINLPVAIRAIPSFTPHSPSHVRPLDLIDLLAGGDGTGSAAGVGINAATGQVHETKAAAIRLGNHQYVRVKNDRVVDGCFIPGGRMPVDSEGHEYTFPSTSLVSYGLIWGGPNVPWEGELLIATTLPEDSDIPTSRVLVMHSNNGLTFNLDAIRALDASATITGFRARVGNSYRSAGPGSKPATPLASIHVIVDGTARFEKLSFANVDPPIDVTCALSDNDHFLTLATTDGGDGNACDWVLWTHPEFLTQSHGQ